MEIIAEQKYLLLSPKKIRPVVEVIKKLRPVEAIAKLPFITKKASEPLAKVIKQALANARNKGLSENDLYFKEIMIGEGPRLPRGQAVSRGQWHPIKKRMSHIKVILEVKKPEIEKKPEIKNKERKNGTKN